MEDKNQIAAAAPTRPGVLWLVLWALLALAGLSGVIAVMAIVLVWLWRRPELAPPHA